MMYQQLGEPALARTATQGTSRHSFGTGAWGRGQGPICIERWIRKARRFDFLLSARRDAAAAIFQKAFEVRGPLRIARHSPAVDCKFVWIYNGLGISFMQVSKWGNS